MKVERKGQTYTLIDGMSNGGYMFMYDEEGTIYLHHFMDCKVINEHAKQKKGGK